MLRVRVEILPHGDESRAEILEERFVGNDGTGGDAIGNYDVYDLDPRGKPYPRELRTGWLGRLEGRRRGPDHRRRLAVEALEMPDA
jgi:hypothetical protein